MINKGLSSNHVANDGSRNNNNNNSDNNNNNRNDNNSGINRPEQQQHPHQERHRMINALEESFPDVINILNQDMKDRSDLAQIPSELLQQRLRPILDSLQRLDAELLLELDRTTESDGAVLRPGVMVNPIHLQIQPAFPAPQDDSLCSVVRYLHLTEVPGKYSVGIFIFPPLAKMPLHDHPGMCVLSRLLYGSLERTSLDLSREDGHKSSKFNFPRAFSGKSSEEKAVKRLKASEDAEHARRSGLLDSLWLRMSWRKTITDEGDDDDDDDDVQHQQQSLPKPNNLPKGSRRAYRKRVDKLEAPQCTILYPWEGNLHQFMAGPHGAAVLDVLVPPYDAQHERDCNYYEIFESTAPARLSTSQQRRQHPPRASGNNSLLYQTATTSSTTTTTKSSSSFCWIVPIEKPESFHCISGHYRNIGSAD
ncbi:hypothetical protein ACA910_002554 [Epithemia clementina (nom. ined.)]